MAKVREFEEGRRCERCGLPLSRYNPNNECHSHAPFKFAEPMSSGSDLLFSGVVLVDPKGGQRMPSENGKAREYPMFRSAGT